jgi:hypothetical protein
MATVVPGLLEILNLKYIVKRSVNVDYQCIVADLLETVDVSLVSGALLFVAPDIDYRSICASLKNIVPFIGCTTQFNMSAKKKLARKYRDETATMVFFFEHALQRIGHLDDIGEPGQRYFSFSLNDERICDLLGRFECFGGVAWHEQSGENGAVFLNGNVLASGTVALAMDYINAKTLTTCGWLPVNAAWRGRITDATGCVVHKISGVSAVDFYLSDVGDAGLFCMHPLLLENSREFRCVTGVDVEAGAISFSLPIAIGESVVITEATRMQVMNASQALVVQNVNEVRAAKLALAVSCFARNELLADLAHKEYDFLRDGINEVVLVSLSGEFVPDNGRTVYQNQHYVVGLLS